MRGLATLPRDGPGGIVSVQGESKVYDKAFCNKPPDLHVARIVRTAPSSVSDRFKPRDAAPQ